MIMAGARGYLPKSCSPREIETAIVTIHKQGYYHSELADHTVFKAVEKKEIWIPKFTAQEIEVMKYCCTDMSYAEIAEKLGTTTRSVEGHRDSLFKKLEINARITLAFIAIELGIVPLELQPDAKYISSRKSRLL
jgi:two-component system invasion response regulator UvrY